jgi:hypothetical protein
MRHRFRLRFSVLTIMIVIALLAGGFAWLRPLTADEAVRIAERFVRENGYTDFTPDDARQLVPESIEFSRDRRDRLERRHNTMRRNAVA